MTDDDEIIQIAYESGLLRGREEMKSDIMAIIAPCLARDCTLQKLMTAIEEL